jgi:hypothetical protein
MSPVCFDAQIDRVEVLRHAHAVGFHLLSAFPLIICVESGVGCEQRRCNDQLAVILAILPPRPIVRHS